LNLILGHARKSGDIISDLETDVFGFDVHVLDLCMRPKSGHRRQIC
jgi:hypothetical protein